MSFNRQGMGRRLLQTLIDEARHIGLHSILANISADQQPSIHLHQTFGFHEVAHLREVGRKFYSLARCRVPSAYVD